MYYIVSKTRGGLIRCSSQEIHHFWHYALLCRPFVTRCWPSISIRTWIRGTHQLVEGEQKLDMYRMCSICNKFSSPLAGPILLRRIWIWARVNRPAPGMFAHQHELPFRYHFSLREFSHGYSINLLFKVRKQRYSRNFTGIFRMGFTCEIGNLGREFFCLLLIFKK